MNNENTTTCAACGASLVTREITKPDQTVVTVTICPNSRWWQILWWDKHTSFSSEDVSEAKEKNAQL